MARKQKSHRSSKHNPESDKPPSDLARYSGIAFEIVAYNLLIIWGGYELDKYMGNKIPWMIILGLILSISGTLYLIFKRLNK